MWSLSETSRAVVGLCAVTVQYSCTVHVNQVNDSKLGTERVGAPVLTCSCCLSPLSWSRTAWFQMRDKGMR
jgi:hypothetical protein